MNKLTPDTTSTISKIIATEMSNQNIRQKTISTALNRDQQAMWRPLRTNNVKFKYLVEICDYLGLELIVRNPAKNCEYYVNRNNKSDEK